MRPWLSLDRFAVMRLDIRILRRLLIGAADKVSARENYAGAI